MKCKSNYEFRRMSSDDIIIVIWRRRNNRNMLGYVRFEVVRETNMKGTVF
jgi:hypothetical protein